jgi:predicted nucleic acid-binding protein
MPILVSDPSMLIDLERAALVEASCRLPQGLVVADLLYNRELAAHGGARWLNSGLAVAELSDIEVQIAQGARADVRQLSLADSFAFALARERRWPLLTGDNALRLYAVSRNLDVHGVLWVIDELRVHRVLSGKQLRVALETIAGHPRCQLPQADVARTLALLSKA